MEQEFDDTHHSDNYMKAVLLQNMLKHRLCRL